MSLHRLWTQMSYRCRRLKWWEPWAVVLVSFCLVFIIYSLWENTNDPHMSQAEIDKMVIKVLEKNKLSVMNQIELKHRKSKFRLNSQEDPVQAIFPIPPDEPGQEQWRRFIGKGKDVQKEEKAPTPAPTKPPAKPPVKMKRKKELMVHIDLKGAHMKVEYFTMLFGLLREQGVTQILMEYDEMFPYSGSLERLRAKNAYTVNDIVRINELATRNGLLIVPLMQSLCRLEFVLKHQEFADLRENASLPSEANPTKVRLYEVLEEMFRQVLHCHPNAEFIHLGETKPKYLGTSPETKRALNFLRMNSTGVIVLHLLHVASLVAKVCQTIQPLMWDDVLRIASQKVLMKSSLGQIIEPVVRCYGDSCDTSLTVALWGKYQKTVPRLWVASSYKVTTKSQLLLPDYKRTINNQLAWRSTLVAMKSIYTHPIAGVILMGPQRLGHFRCLKQLLPVAIPPLVISLKLLKNHTIHNAIAGAGTALGCLPVILKNPISLQTFSFKGCVIGGEKIYDVMPELHKAILEAEHLSLHNRKWRGVIHPSDPKSLDFLFAKQPKLKVTFQRLLAAVWAALREAYDDVTVREWMLENIHHRLINNEIPSRKIAVI